MADVGSRAADATARALERDPASATAHIARALLALLLERDREKAARAWAQAVELDSSKVEARMFRAVFDLCYVRGAFDEAVRELRETLALDPLSVEGRTWLAITLSWAGRFDEAAAEAERGVELDPNAFFPRWALLHALALGAHPAEGVRVGTEMLARFGRLPWILYPLALASGAAGRHDLADAHYAELEARSRSEYVQPHALAAAALGAGRREDVFRQLQKGVQLSDPLLAVAAGHWPGFASMRADPEFAAVLKQMGWDRPLDLGGTPTR
jgi:tetratricopeptide (TPR) repeat protein